MRYHYEMPTVVAPVFGETYYCDHPVYYSCTLFRIGDKGLAVIQQYYNKDRKTTRWEKIDDALRNAIYMHKDFKRYFDRMAGEPVDGLYPTVTVRQLMWALKMKPLKREVWETYFDRSPI